MTTANATSGAARAKSDNSTEPASSAGPARSFGPLIGEPSSEHPIPNGANQEEPTVLGREEKQGAEVQNAEVAHGKSGRRI